MINKVYGLLGISSKAGKVVSGMDVVKEGLLKGSIKLVIIAVDASQKTIQHIELLCSEKNVPLIVFGTIFENSKAIGKVNRAVIGVKDKNLAEAINKEILRYIQKASPLDENVKEIITGGEGFGKN